MKRTLSIALALAGALLFTGQAASMSLFKSFQGVTVWTKAYSIFLGIIATVSIFVMHLQDFRMFLVSALFAVIFAKTIDARTLNSRLLDGVSYRRYKSSSALCRAESSPLPSIFTDLDCRWNTLKCGSTEFTLECDSFPFFVFNQMISVQVFYGAR
jgi:hypothetical protein